MITISYPARAPVDSIILPNPVLGNSDQYDIKTRFRKSMNSTLYSYKNTKPVHTFLYTFTGLDKAKIDELIAFIDDSGGSEIKLVDHRGVTWRGFIINQPFEARTIGPKDEPDAGSANCIEVSDVTIEFKCREAIESIRQSLILDDTITETKV